MSSFDERRAHPRRPSSARIRWVPRHDGEVRIAHFGDVSEGGARVLTQLAPELGDELRFEVLDPEDVAVSTGIARVAWTRPSEGEVGLSFLSLGVDRELALRLALTPARSPPPLPGAASDARALPETVDVSLLAEELPSASSAPSTTAGDDGHDAKGELPPIVIGLDFGADFIRAAMVVAGHPQAIRVAPKQDTTPSVVSFELDGTWSVGAKAVEHATAHPERALRRAKLALGARPSGTLEGKATRGTEGLGLAVTPAGRHVARVERANEAIRLESIAARLLDHVRNAVESTLHARVEGVVLSVPAGFGPARRAALLDAAREAHLPVLRLVSDTAAAAIAHAHLRKQGAPPSRVGIWTMGVGGFSFSVVALRENGVEVLVSEDDEHDEQRGALAIDDAIVAYLLEQARAASTEPLVMVPKTESALRRLAEHAKRTLSSAEETELTLPGLGASAPVTLMLTRATLEELARPVVERLVQIARAALLRARIAPEELDEIVLAGSPTRMPAIEAAIVDLFKKTPSKLLSPERAISFGAALLANGLFATPPLESRDLLPYTIRLASRGHEPAIVLERGTPLPCHGEATIAASSLGAVYAVVAQEVGGTSSRLEPIGALLIDDRALWNGGTVRVRIDIDADGCLHVEARHGRTGIFLPCRLDDPEGDAVSP